jgi:hypothetical protein
MPTAEKSTESALGIGTSRLKKSGSSVREAHGPNTGVILVSSPLEPWPRVLGEHLKG